MKIKINAQIKQLPKTTADFLIPQISVPGYQAVVTQDPALRWDMFVNHYQDQERAKRDPKFSYEVAPYEYHVGPNPPSGAKPLGILYPRAGTLGGCIIHNALILITPHASDWDHIATITGDSSWSASNMTQYLKKVQEWLPTEPTDPTILADDLKLTQHLFGGAAVMGVGSVFSLKIYCPFSWISR
jgi:choline dehydrogenase